MIHKNILLACLLAPTLQAQLPADAHWFYDYGGPESSEAFASEVMGRYLYTGGLFLRTVGNSSWKNLARFDLETEEWSGIPGLSPVLNGSVRAVHAGDDGWLYFGGNFSNAAGVTSSRIARYNPQTHAITGLIDSTTVLVSAGQQNGPTNGEVRAILKVGNYVYAGGFYTGPSGSPNDEKHIRRYNLTANRWEKMGTGLNGQVNALAKLPDGSILAGGAFTSALSRWNGTSWSAYGGGVGTPTQGVVRTIAVAPNGIVYVGGDFLQVGSGGGQIATSFVASYNPTTSTWSNLAGGFDDQYMQSNGTTFPAEGVYDFKYSNGILYAGGDFQANPARTETNLDHVAYWDGSGQWKTLGSGIGNTGSQIVNCLAIGPEGSLYVGGVFSEGWRNASSANATFARWDFNRDFTNYVPGAAESPLSVTAQSATQLTLSFRTRTGTQYQVRSSATLDALGTIVSGSAFTGNGATRTLTVPKSGTKRFYRVEATSF